MSSKFGFFRTRFSLTLAEVGRETHVKRTVRTVRARCACSAQTLCRQRAIAQRVKSGTQKMKGLILVGGLGTQV